MPHIVLFGASGFVGGSLLHSLLTSPPPNGEPSTITAVSGSQSKAKQISTWAAWLSSRNFVSPSAKLQVEVAGRGEAGFYDSAKTLAANADLVVQAATSDDLRLAQVINEGLVQAKKAGFKGNLVHFSGIQLIESEPVGHFVDVKNDSDLDLKALEGISDDAAHRGIDLDIVNRISAGDFWGSIICPALVWGQGLGPCKRLSVQSPDMILKAIINNRGVHCGQGTNVWSTVHIDDLITLTMSIIAHHLSHPDPSPSSLPAPHSTFYFASHSTPIEFRTLATNIGTALHQLQLVASPEAGSVPVPAFDKSQKGVRVEDDARAGQADENEARAPIWPSRSNSLCSSDRGQKEFGWKAKRVYDQAAIQEDAKETIRVWVEDGSLQDLLKQQVKA